MRISFVRQTNFFRLSAARAVLVLILPAALKFLAASAPSALASDWSMVNHDLANSRHQADEHTIAPDTVARLAPHWTLTTAGDVSITPAVVNGALYFPDAGGKLWKVDARNGAVLWSHTIAEYNGIANSVSRQHPAFADGMIFLGDITGAHFMAVDAQTGALRWITQLDTHPNALVTGSPVVVGDRVYIGVSSTEQGRKNDPTYACCTFRGSMLALDIHSGKILWKTYTMPENDGKANGWSGGAIITTPAIDAEQGVLYISTDHQYTQPEAVTACLIAARNDWDASCYPPEARFNSVMALDLATGAPRWTFFGAGAEVWKLACGPLPESWSNVAVGGMPVRICPPPGDFVNWAFAAGAPQLFTIPVNGQARKVVGVAQKSGVYWAFDAATGAVVWHTLVGPYSEPGGLTWGAAYDGQRLYLSLTNFEHAPYRLLSGALTDGGSWVALDPATGKILWQTADPQGGVDYAAPVIANGVVYVGSLAHAGDQMYALDAASGAVLWRFAAGGSVGTHPALADSSVFWGSGFGRTGFGGVPNNKFYAFTIDGK